EHMLKLGVDTGGTFTDFILLSDEGIRTYKTPSTPDDPARAIMGGVRHFFDEIPDALEIVHGTTVGTNAFLERKGAKTVLVTTAGFEDVLFIGRQNRARLYDLDIERPPQIIGREQCIGIKERLRADGSVQSPLGGKGVGKRLRAFCRQSGAESVVVCLLHSYANPGHERMLAEMLAPLGLPLTLSSDILPEFREYERLTTTLINGYLAPVIAAYIGRLAAQLPGVPLSIQQSNGGVLPAAGIAERAVHTVLSGPAGGVGGAFHLAREMGIDKIITFDMGGTSTDVSLCDGQPTLTRDYRIDGYPVRVPLLDIHTVGAGGGSLAWGDAGGLLQVGPASAGADPGPVCYGRGEGITVTDANLYLGRLLADRFLGGEMVLDRARVERYMTHLGAQLGLVPMEAALGIIRIVNAGMAKAVRAVSLERGHDPKEFTLFSFGGASGLHCCELADELGMERIVVPARAGILSAQGMALADPVLDYGQALFLAGDELTAERLRPAFIALEEKGRQEAASLCRQGELVVERFLDLRYRGQSHELTVPMAGDFTASFHDAHARNFGYRLDDAPLELVSIRCTLRLSRQGRPLPRAAIAAAGQPRPTATSVVQLAAGDREVGVFVRRELGPGQAITGPALVVDDYTTVLVGEGWRLRVDALLNLDLTR
ncbi:MAG: hydantoinase/oxoprolinase family protein, partial [Desulfobulbaceae bacterium]|nr:hydantoinase/oxoprolinase family protein [Desulfobulbaceae bacterium]